MKLDKAGIDFIIEVEGLRLKPYKDTKGIWTIGIGNTFYEDGTPVKGTDKPITKERVFELFTLVSSKFEDNVTKVVKQSITQNQFNALFSFSYNVGMSAFNGSTLLKKINLNPNDELGITNQFLQWKKPIEVLGRRKKEIKLYFKK